MPKLVKLAVSIFIGVDLFVLGYLGLAQLRYQLFGTNQVPGIGSAFDMAIFLFPALAGYVAGDRLYHFLTLKERKAALLKKASELPPATPEPDAGEGEWELAAGASHLMHGSVWEDRGWDDEARKGEK
ncbi:MAG: hypothetical protein JWP00_1520 [Chloroflexi bacterium]|jgi:hypothetical protein|nr:hypothetical protein [Chloroflexota bacterium]